MPSYYERLSAGRLRRCYELAPPEVQAYLQAEVQFISGCITPQARVLELGCGYGRVLSALAQRPCWLVGIDLSLDSLTDARQVLSGQPNVALARMNVDYLAFRPGSFDLVYCPQNGISAFHVDQRKLLVSTVRLLAPGGTALFFSYAEAFWPHRITWFRIQAAQGLIGDINEEATGNGTIVCRDGFTATAVSPEDFLKLAHGLGRRVSVSVLQHSSVVCRIEV